MNGSMMMRLSPWVDDVLRRIGVRYLPGDFIDKVYALMAGMRKGKFTFLHLGVVIGYSGRMKLVINGIVEELRLNDATVAGVLAAKRWSFPLIIVRLNGAPVRRDAWADTAVSDGDVMEAAHLMSGG